MAYCFKIRVFNKLYGEIMKRRDEALSFSLTEAGGAKEKGCIGSTSEKDSNTAHGKCLYLFCRRSSIGKSVGFVPSGCQFESGRWHFFLVGLLNALTFRSPQPMPVEGYRLHRLRQSDYTIFMGSFQGACNEYVVSI